MQTKMDNIRPNSGELLTPVPLVIEQRYAVMGQENENKIIHEERYRSNITPSTSKAQIESVVTRLLRKKIRKKRGESSITLRETIIINSDAEAIQMVAKVNGGTLHDHLICFAINLVDKTISVFEVGEDRNLQMNGVTGNA